MTATDVLKHLSNGWRLVLCVEPFKGFRLVSNRGASRVVQTDVVTSLKEYLTKSELDVRLSGCRCIEYRRKPWRSKPRDQQSRTIK